MEPTKTGSKKPPKKPEPPFTEIPKTGFMRLVDVLRFIPISKTVWWEGVKSGVYPTPVRLSARTTAWRCEDIRELIAELGGEA